MEHVVDLLKIDDAVSAIPLRDAALRFIASSQETLIAVQDADDFDSLDKDLMKELIAAVTGNRGSKRQRNHELDLPEGSEWPKLTAAQLRRACAERNLATSGNKAALFARLPSQRVVFAMQILRLWVIMQLLLAACVMSPTLVRIAM